MTQSHSSKLQDILDNYKDYCLSDYPAYPPELNDEQALEAIKDLLESIVIDHISDDRDLQRALKAIGQL